MSETRAPVSYNLHDVVRVRTNVRIVPEFPGYLRVDAVDPDLEVVRAEGLSRPDPETVRAGIGSPSTCDLGDGRVFYEFPMPLLHYLGVSENWKFYVEGLTKPQTKITTAFPSFNPKPVAARATELLSRITYFVLGMKLWEKGHALCHASALAKGDDAYLFFGYIGSGKTTVSRALMGSVCDSYLSDDTSLVDRQGNILCWPEAHAAHGEGGGMPLLRYVKRRSHVTFLPDFPIRRRARARGIYFLERGRDEIKEIDLDEAARRTTLINLDEMSRYWNSPASQIVNQYAYFYPELDLGRLSETYASIVAGFVGKAEKAYVLRTRGPTFESLKRLIAGSA